MATGGAGAFSFTFVKPSTIVSRHSVRSWAFDGSVTGSTTSRSRRTAEKTKLVPPASRVRTTRGSSA